MSIRSGCGIDHEQWNVQEVAQMFYIQTRKLLLDAKYEFDEQLLYQLKESADHYCNRYFGQNDASLDWSVLTNLIDSRINELNQQQIIPVVANIPVDNQTDEVFDDKPMINKSNQRQTKPQRLQQHEHVPDGSTTSTEKLQTLLLQQRDMTAQELDSEKSKHRALTEELAELTSVLMEATLSMQSTVTKQNMKLDAIQQHATENKDELQEQKKKLNEREKSMTISLFGTIGTLVWIVALFIVTYVVIRMFPKPR